MDCALAAATAATTAVTVGATVAPADIATIAAQPVSDAHGSEGRLAVEECVRTTAEHITDMMLGRVRSRPAAGNTPSPPQSYASAAAHNVRLGNGEKGAPGWHGLNIKWPCYGRKCGAA